MFNRPASARTSRLNEASAIEGLMKEAQRQQLYSGVQTTAPRAAAATAAASSKLHHREEERRLGIVSDDDSDEGEEFDEVRVPQFGTGACRQRLAMGSSWPLS
jgi:hypothetical protein